MQAHGKWTAWLAGWLLIAMAPVVMNPVSVQTTTKLQTILSAAKDITASMETPTPADTADQTRTQRVVLVSIPDRKLAVLENGNVIAYFPVAVGAAVSPSPEGEFEIVNHVANPTYYHEGLLVAAGKDNPVGTRWIGLSVKGYGIHGTNVPRSIGHATSHGCIRLRNRDIERLYTMLSVGDTVKIRGERDDQIAQVFGGYADGTTVASANAPAQTNGQ